MLKEDVFLFTNLTPHLRSQTKVTISELGRLDRLDILFVCFYLYKVTFTPTTYRDGKVDFVQVTH